MTDERKLLSRARQFDERALAEVYDTYSPKLYRYAIRLLTDEDLAEECVADTFSRFLTAMKNGSGPTEYLQAYLYRVAHNWITDTYRRKPPPELPLEPVDLPGGEPDPAHLVGERLEHEQVRAALLLLTPEQRQVVVLRFLEEMENQEVAAVLNKPVGAVKALQHRAINALRRLLVKEMEA